MNGPELCCRFSRVTNKLNYCGPLKAHETFLEFFKTKQNEQKIKELLSKFEGLYPYLKFISSKHNLDPFDYKVIEAYWLGNELLDAFSKEDYASFLPELEKRGLPAKITKQLQSTLPKYAVPHHTFHVLFVGVGRVTGSVPATLENMQKCMASWGTVLESDENQIKIKGPTLEQTKNKFLIKETERTVFYQKQLIQPNTQDTVAMHWNECVHILNKEQAENLEKYTKKIIEAVNSVENNF